MQCTLIYISVVPRSLVYADFCIRARLIVIELRKAQTLTRSVKGYVVLNLRIYLASSEITVSF